MDATPLMTETTRLQRPTSHGTDKKQETNGIAASNGRQQGSPVVWRNVAALLYVHLAAIYGLYQAGFQIKVLTVLWGEYLHLMTMTSLLQVDGRRKFVYTLQYVQYTYRRTYTGYVYMFKV